MADSADTPISLGRWDPYRRTPSLSLRNGRIKFLPGPGSLGQFDVKEAAFPAGARLEYLIQKGDMYFDGDHSQSLGATLWVIEPNGGKSLLASGFVLYMSLTVAARNLKKHEIPFRAVSYYTKKDGQVVENEIPIPRSGNILRADLLLGICVALLPYGGGFLVIGTRNIGSLALAGAVICVLCTSAAYFVRRQRDPVRAKHRLIVDPILYGFEFAFTAIVIRYMFMH